MINLWEDFVVTCFSQECCCEASNWGLGRVVKLPRDVDILLEKKLKGYVIMLYSSQICVLTHTYMYHNMYIIYSNYKWDTYNRHIFAYTYTHFIWAVVQTCLSSQRCWPPSDLFIFSDGCNHHRQGTKSGALWKACADPNDIWTQMRGT